MHSSMGWLRVGIGQHSTIGLLNSYGLLSPDILLSHATGATPADAMALASANAHISSTPDTELQMALGEPVCFRSDLQAMSSLGIDCHSNNSGDILSAMRLALQSARGIRNQKFIDVGKSPKSIHPRVEEAFNLGTIQGARAVGMENEIGSLAVGKLADIVIFDACSPAMVCAAEENPVAAIVLHASVRDIDTVIINGQVRKRNGKLIPVSLSAGVTESMTGSKREEGVTTLEWERVASELAKSRTILQQKIAGLDMQEARRGVIKAFHIDETNIDDKIS